MSAVGTPTPSATPIRDQVPGVTADTSHKTLWKNVPPSAHYIPLEPPIRARTTGGDAEQLRSLAERLAAVREEERKRISREIHDELGQALTALKLDLAWVHSRSAGEVRERIGAMFHLLDGTVSAVRRISNDLRPGILDDLGLAAAIGWQAEQFAARTGIECVVRILAEGCELDERRSTTLFRALQEALTNVARHAQAHRVVIVLHQRDGNVELCVADDGRGISPADTRNQARLGLIGMGERARACGGLMRITPRRRAGTILTVRLPLRREAQGERER